jgi:hypothetical protein
MGAVMKWSELASCVSCIVLSLSFVVDLCALQPKKNHGELRKPYVKAGINGLQRDVAQDVWGQGLKQPQNIIKEQLNSPEFQATIGRMQENLGITEVVLNKKAKSLSDQMQLKNTDEFETWLPAVKLLLPRYSQLVCDISQIYLENNEHVLQAAIGEKYKKNLEALNPQWITSYSAQDVSAAHELRRDLDALYVRIDTLFNEFFPLTLKLDDNVVVANIKGLIAQFEGFLLQSIAGTPFTHQTTSYQYFFLKLQEPSSAKIIGIMPKKFQEKLFDKTVVLMYHVAQQSKQMTYFDSDFLGYVGKIHDPEMKKLIEN